MDSGAIDGPAMSDSEATPANLVGSTMANPVVADPTTANPNITIPAATDPHINGPGVVGPTATDPSVVDPTTTDPGPVGPATANNNVPGPTVANSGVTATVPQPSPIGVTTDTPSLVHHSPSGQDIPDRMESPMETVYPKFAAPEVFVHLSSISNVDGWSNLVRAYLKFETVSPSKSVSFLCPVLFCKL